MEKLSRLLFVFIIILTVACSDDNPVETVAPAKTISTSDYGYFIQTGFYKIWSDSSWEMYDGVVSINNNEYVAVLNSDGTTYYYNTVGYAGFKPAGDNSIIFKTPITPLDDTLFFGTTYTKYTTFTYHGFEYTFIMERTLADTQTVSIGLGTYNSCLWIKSKGTLRVSNQSESQYSEGWLAKGPSDIKIISNNLTKEMIEGKVNNIQYGGQNSYNLPLRKMVAKISINPQVFLYRIDKNFVLNAK